VRENSFSHEVCITTAFTQLIPTCLSGILLIYRREFYHGKKKEYPLLEE